MEITHYTTRSSYMRCLQTAVRPFKPRLVSSGKPQPGGAQKLTPHRSARRHCEVVERQTGGLWIYDMRVKTAAASRPVERRIYYFAGGGWQQPPSSQHWKFCAELCRALGPDTGVSIVSHPLAPHTPGEQGMPVLRAFYDVVMDQAASSGQRVVLAGDSSGGNLVLCLAMCALAEAPHPVEHLAAAKPLALRTALAAVLLISPAVDLRPMRREGVYATTERHDPVLTIESHNAEAEQWAAGADPGELWLSPINAEADVLARSGVQVLAVTGGYDILTPDALMFRDACEKGGVSGHWLQWEQQMHCFPLAFMYGLPESVESKDWIVERLRRV